METAKGEPTRAREPIGRRVAQNVERIRAASGTSQQQVSDRLMELGRPLAVSAISKIEKSQRKVDVDELVALALALGVNPSALLLDPTSGDEVVQLAPRMSASAWAAWQWADGYAPLPTRSGDEGFNDTKEWAEFIDAARPPEKARFARAPLAIAALALYRRAERLVQKPTKGTMTVARRDIDRIVLELDELEDRARGRSSR